MKNKKLVVAIFITALVVTLLLLVRESYYLAISLVVGTILIGHREIWALIKRRERLPVDERVKENINKAVRIGFIFLVIALVVLMLPYTEIITDDFVTGDTLSGLFISVGLMYVLAYLYYDRVKPGLGERGMKVFRGFLMTSGISLAVAVISVFLHNVIYALCIICFGDDFWERTGITDEPVFFILTFISVGVFAIGIIGSLALYIKGLCTRVNEKQS
ncbi:hypothetical protein ACFLYN_04780 [Chloroflexota bacterium]